MEINTILLDNSIWNLLIRFFINLIVLFVLVRLIYYKYSRKEEYLFSYFLMGVMIFLICAILGTLDLKVGTALGLFAIFAIIRFRTVQYSVKDITYVFIIIGISVINSQANIPPPILGAIVINVSILLITIILEIFLQKKSLNKLRISYNNLELLKPGRKIELMADLSRLTGQPIEKILIREINIGRSNAELDVFFKEKITEYSEKSSG
jgi:hypothetical protein